MPSDFANFDSSMPLQSSIRANALPLVIDPLVLGPSMFLHCLEHLDTVVSASGKSCLSLLLLTCDKLHLDLPSFFQNLARPGPSLSAPNSLHSRTRLPSQASFRLDSSLIASRCACSSVSSSMLNAANARSNSLLRGFKWLGLAMMASAALHSGPFLSASDHVGLESPVILKGFACIGRPLTILCAASADSMSSLRGAGHSRKTFSTHGASRIGSQTVMFDFVTVEPLPSFKGFGHLGMLLLVITNVQSGTSLSTYDITRMEPSPALQGLACPDPSPLTRSRTSMKMLALVLDSLHMGFPIFMQSPGHLDFTVLAFSACGLGVSTLVFDHENTRSSMSPRAHARADSASLVSRLARSSLTASVSNCAQAGLSSPSQNLAQAGLTIFVWGISRMRAFPSLFDIIPSGTLLPLRSPGRLGAIVLICGITCSAFSLTASDAATVSSGPLIRSLARSGLILLALGSIYIGAASSFRGCGYVATFSAALGMGRFGAFPPALRNVLLSLFVALQSFCRLDPFLFLPDLARGSLSFPLHSFTCADLFLLVSDMPRLDARPPMSNYVQLGSSALPQSVVHLGVPASFFCISCSGLSSSTVDLPQITAFVLLRSFTCCGSSLTPCSTL